MDDNSLTPQTIPSEIDILNEIENFSTDNNNNNSSSSISSQSAKLPIDYNVVDVKSTAKKLQNPNETVLTQETVKIFSLMPKNLPFKYSNEYQKVFFFLILFSFFFFSQQFDLLFNDVQFFKTSSVQGGLLNTNLRCISWMVCVKAFIQTISMF